MGPDQPSRGLSRPSCCRRKPTVGARNTDTLAAGDPAGERVTPQPTPSHGGPVAPPSLSWPDCRVAVAQRLRLATESPTCDWDKASEMRAAVRQAFAGGAPGRPGQPVAPVQSSPKFPGASVLLLTMGREFLPAPRHGRGGEWVGTERGCLWSVSPSPPVVTVRAAFIAHGDRLVGLFSLSFVCISPISTEVPPC